MIKTWLKALATAFIFFTRLPMPLVKSIEAEDEGRALLCFPFVGLVIGILWWLLASGLHSILSPLILAAMLTAFSAIVTGGLHLDGLADSADGWLGGLGDVERTLNIMHDPRCGSAALVAVTCLLLLKFAALTVIVEHQLWVVLIISPLLGRCVAPLLFIPGTWFYAVYVKPKGIAKNFIEHCPGFVHFTTVLAIFCCGLALAKLIPAIGVIAICAFTLILLRHLMIKRLGGSTGDTAGAATEIIETVALMSGGALLS